MLIVCIAAVCLLLVGLTIRLRQKVKEEEREPELSSDEPLIFGPTVNITAFEIEKLSNIAYMEQLEALFRQANVEQRLPAFYEKYVALNKGCKEQYLENLLLLFAKGKEGSLDRFMKKYTELSTQDILMMFMLDAGFDNKSIMRMLWINYETFKKRKSRLKSKCGVLGIPFDFTRGNVSWLQKPPVEA